MEKAGTMEPGTLHGTLGKAVANFGIRIYERCREEMMMIISLLSIGNYYCISNMHVCID